MDLFTWLNANINYIIICFFAVISVTFIALYLWTRNRMWIHMITFTGGFFALNYVEALSANFVGPSTQWFTKNAFAISIILALNPFFGFLVQPVVGHWSDHVRTPIGQRKPFSIFSMVLLAVMLFVTPFAPTLWMFVVFVAVFQFANDIGFASFFPLLGDLFPDKYRGRAAMMQETASTLGMFVGMTFGGILYGQAKGLLAAQNLPAANAGGPYPLAKGFLLNGYSLGALIIIAGYCIVIFLVREPKRAPDEHIHRFSFVEYFKQIAVDKIVFRLYWVILLISIMNTLLQQYWTMYAPPFLGISVEDASLISRWRYLVNLLTVPFFAWGSDYLGRRPLLIAGAIMWLLSSLLGTIVRSGEQVWIFYLIFVLQGIGWSGLIGPLMPYLLDLVPKEKFGQYCGALMIFRGGSRLIIMPIIGAVIQYLLPKVNGTANWYVIWPLSVVASAICIWLLWVMKPTKQAIIPPECPDTTQI